MKTITAGHPTVCRVEEEKNLAAGLKNLEGEVSDALLSSSVERYSCFLTLKV
jgi:hypothetical protein